MNIFISHSSSGGNEHLETFFRAIEQWKQERPDITVTLYRKAEESEPQNTKDHIDQADMVIGEASVGSTGSGIELGWAHAAGKSIIAFHQGDSEPSPILQFITDDIHVYLTEDHLLEVLRKL